ncbi:MAG TPA: DUF2079 domain-containing protein [Polyangiales bacterium]|nr:DUF2079 domain-containing protein [Polyangiales bacterium]
MSGATTNDAATDASDSGTAKPVPRLRAVSPGRSGRFTNPAMAWREVALAAAVLAMAFASIWLCVLLFHLPVAQRDAYLLANTLERAHRKRWLIELAIAAMLPCAFALGSVAVWREAAIPWLRAAADRLCPFTLAFSLPMLLSATLWATRPLPFLVCLLGVVLGAERLLVRALSPDRTPTVAENDLRWPSHLLPLAIVIAASTAYALWASHYSIMRHHRLGSSGFDLGIFDNLMVNALEGRPFYSSVAVPTGSYLSNHAEFGMYLFLPIYVLHPSSETLLVLQSTFMGFAAVPLYFFAATRLSRTAAAAIAVAYLFFAPLHGPNFFDFHWMPMSMLFFFWLFHALATRRRITVAVLSVVICSLREDAPFGLIATGLFLIATGYWPRLGAALTFFSAVWFVIVKFAIMPLAGPWWFSDIYRDLFAPGEKGYGSVVRTILVNPSYFLKTLLTEPKLIYALHMLAPLALLPLRRPALWLLAIPGFVVTLMTTSYAPTTSISFQYTTHFIPFLFAAAVLAIEIRGRRLGPAAARASVIALCLGVLCHSYVFGAILQHQSFTSGFNQLSFEITPAEQKRYADLKALTAKIPPRASVAATEQEVPHVSSRPNVFTLKITAGRAEYLLVNRYRVGGEARKHLEEVLQIQPYDVVATQGDFLLFRRGKTSEEGKRAFRTLHVSLPPSAPAKKP